VWESHIYPESESNEKDDERRIEDGRSIKFMLWRNHLDVQEPKDFRVLRVFIGSVNMDHFIRDWPYDRDEESKRQRRALEYTRHPGSTPRNHWRGPARGIRLAAGRRIAGGHQVVGANPEESGEGRMA
jgi:hypothetical protein